MNRLVVMKFGGTSLGTPARIRLAARRVRVHLRAGERAVIVVSAMGKATDRILHWVDAVAPSRAVAPAPGPESAAREVDRALATGEELSAGLLGAALRALGVAARSLRADEAGLEAVGPFGGGVLTGLDVERLGRLLDTGVTPVVAGFQAVRRDGETVTLGRGGSDVTAVFLAMMLGAAACHIVTDVDGVYDTDPRTNPDARRLPELSHAALVQLSGRGAEVVHPMAALYAERFGTPLHVYNFRAPPHSPAGTRVAPATTSLARASRAAAVASSDLSCVDDDQRAQTRRRGLSNGRGAKTPSTEFVAAPEAVHDAGSLGGAASTSATRGFGAPVPAGGAVAAGCPVDDERVAAPDPAAEETV